MAGKSDKTRQHNTVPVRLDGMEKNKVLQYICMVDSYSIESIESLLAERIIINKVEEFDFASMIPRLTHLHMNQQKTIFKVSNFKFKFIYLFLFIYFRIFIQDGKFLNTYLL